MGVCNSTDKSTDAALQSEDPPVAAPEEDATEKKVPVTEDFKEPAADVSALSDGQDVEKSAADTAPPAQTPEAAQPEASSTVETGQIEPAKENEAVKEAASPEENAESPTKTEDPDPKTNDQDKAAGQNENKAVEEVAPKTAPAPKKQSVHAAKKKKEELTKKKVEKEGADKTAEGESPNKAEISPEEKFRAAAESGDDKAVAAMMKAGVDVNCADANGRTALHIAADKGFADMIGRLTAHKKIKTGVALVSTKDTPLHMACAGGQRECAVLIVRGGALFRSGPQQQQQTTKLCQAKNKAGKTPAQVSTDAQLAQWLQGANPGSGDPPWNKRA